MESGTSNPKGITLVVSQAPPPLCGFDLSFVSAVLWFSVSRYLGKGAGSEAQHISQTSKRSPTGRRRQVHPTALRKISNKSTTGFDSRICSTLVYTEGGATCGFFFLLGSLSLSGLHSGKKGN
jgi:hypothetical protein